MKRKGFVEPPIALVITFLVMVVIVMIAVIFLAFNRTSVETTFRVATESLQTFAYPAGFLLSSLEGSHLADAALRTSAAGRKSNTGSFDLFMRRISSQFSHGRYDISIDAMVETTTPVFCGNTQQNNLAFCQNSCAPGRGRFTDGDNTCFTTRAGVCCKEAYDTEAKRYVQGLDGVAYCAGGQGVCEIYSCSPGRLQLADPAGGCTGAFSAAAGTVPVSSVNPKAVCCSTLDAQAISESVFTLPPADVAIPIPHIRGGESLKITVGR